LELPDLCADESFFCFDPDREAGLDEAAFDAGLADFLLDAEVLFAVVAGFAPAFTLPLAAVLTWLRLPRAATWTGSATRIRWPAGTLVPVT